MRVRLQRRLRHTAKLIVGLLGLVLAACLGTLDSNDECREIEGAQTSNDGRCTCRPDYESCEDDEGNFACCLPDDESSSWCERGGDELWLCDQPDELGPVGSRLYECVDRQWHDVTLHIDDICRDQGYDFGHGCTSDGQKVTLACAHGPGSACDETTGANACVPATSLIARCEHGRLAHIDCAPPPGEVCRAGDESFPEGTCRSIDGRDRCVCFNP